MDTIEATPTGDAQVVLSLRTVGKTGRCTYGRDGVRTTLTVNKAFFRAAPPAEIAVDALDDHDEPVEAFRRPGRVTDPATLAERAEKARVRHEKAVARAEKRRIRERRAFDRANALLVKAGLDPLPDPDAEEPADDSVDA